MPAAVPVPTKSPGDILTASLWNSFLRDNINKLLNTGHRVLTVAQFAALTGNEGTKGSIAPDEVYLEVDATNGIQWHLAYESGETTFKWRFLGGPPLFSEVATAEATSSTTYAVLTTAGPSIALPRSGDYDVEIGAAISAAAAGSGFLDRMSYDIGGTGASDNDAVMFPSGANDGSRSRRRRKTGLTPVTLTAKYKNGNAVSETYQDRFMAVRPVRLRHDA